MKDLKINKELVSEVLGKEVSKVNIIGDTLNYVIPNYESQEDNELVYIDLGLHLNIYEFAFKCKEWAYNKDYYIYSTVCFAHEGASYITKDDNIGKRLKTFLADTEVEAIIEACNYILKGL